MDSFGEAIEFGLAVALFTFLILVSIGLVTLRWRRHRNLPRPARMKHLWRYLLGRAAVAAGVGLAALAILGAFLTLNTYRPQTDTTPSIRIDGPAGRTTVRLNVEDCWSSADLQLRVDPPHGSGSGARSAGRAELYSDQGGIRPIELGSNGVGELELDDPSSKRGLLSCYIALPTVAGADGPVRVELQMADYMQVDTVESIPAPDGYRNDSWIWDCPAGRKCPALTTAGFAFEDGAKQVIVVVLASMIGAIIALIIGEAVFKPIRRRLDGDGGGSGSNAPPT
ncbi:MAG: hypothetical protein KDB62_00245 [Solirubrobacterales bacterium]|nr:hypothetical protein [Solirubrobacterales bacterium]